MRAALDNVVCGLARRQDPFCTCKDTAFPYTQNEADWNASIRTSLEGVPKPAKKITKSVQPRRNAPTPNPLVILNKLSNIRHARHCNFGLGYARGVTFRIHCNDSQVFDLMPEKALYLGDVYDYPLPINKRPVEPSARVQLSGPLLMTIREMLGREPKLCGGDRSGASVKAV
jgi:hypothetical protein